MIEEGVVRCFHFHGGESEGTEEGSLELVRAQCAAIAACTLKIRQICIQNTDKICIQNTPNLYTKYADPSSLDFSKSDSLKPNAETLMC